MHHHRPLENYKFSSILQHRKITSETLRLQLKKKSDKGSPYLNPQPIINSSIRQSLTRIETDAVLKHSDIRDLHFKEKIIFSK